jgi:hypothetical protein
MYFFEPQGGMRRGVSGMKDFLRSGCLRHRQPTVFRLTDFFLCAKVLKISTFYFLILSPPYSYMALRV